MAGKYKEWLDGEKLLLVEAWARDGLTDEQIAHNIGVSYSTFKEWKNKYSAFSAALKKGKEVVDVLVENALLKRALGYSYEEVRQEIDEKGKKKISKVTRQVLPDTTAQIFWLKNRRPDIWRNKPIETIAEEMADDGLFDALAKSLQAKMQDDSDMLPKEDAE